MIHRKKSGSAKTCPDRRKHTHCPDGYVEWHEWAESKSVHHDQVRCPGCGLFAIWKRRKPAVEAAA